MYLFKLNFLSFRFKMVLTEVKDSWNLKWNKNPRIQNKFHDPTAEIALICREKKPK